MQHLRQLLVAAAIICTLTYSTFAGDMNFPVEPLPSPTPTSVISEEAPDATTASETSVEDTSDSYLVEAALSILESLAFAL